MAEGSAAYFVETQFTSLSDALVFAPVGLVYFLLAPFPWSISGVRQVLTLPETLFWYWLILKCLRGIPSLSRKSPATFLMIVIQLSVLVLPYSLVSANAGTAYRHRAQVLPYFMILAAEGWARSRRLRGDVRSIDAIALSKDPGHTSLTTVWAVGP